MSPSAKLVIDGLPLFNPAVGLGAYTLRLIEGLLRHAPSLPFQVVVPSWIAVPSTLPNEAVIRLSGAPQFNNPLLTAIFWGFRVTQFAANLPPECVFHAPAPITGLRHARITVVTIHDVLYRTLPGYFGRFGIRKSYLLATERYAANSSMVFTQSAYSRHDIVAKTRIPETKVQILSPWPSRAFFELESVDERTESVRRRLGLPLRYWLYLGGYDRRKNVEFLVKAYAQARRQIRSLPPLVLAGDIPSQRHGMICDVAGTIRSTKLSAETIFLAGAIENADLPYVYRGASLLVYPSLAEGFGLPPVEAMAVGTPVLVADNSSLPEVTRNSHCLFSASDEESLVDKLVAAATDESQFRVSLPQEYTEEHGIHRYQVLLAEAARKAK